MSDAPALSVVIPSVNGWGDLETCLRAAVGQRQVAVEVVVVDRVGEDLRRRVAGAHPGVVLIRASSGTTIPALRAMGVRAARAPVVGIIEDHIVLPDDWALRMLAAHADGAEIVGGAIDNAACERIVDWAAFLCEYSHCLSPAPSGSAEWLVGNNVTYRRQHLVRFLPILEAGRWENELHDAMRTAGIALVSRPDIRVGHKKHYTTGEYLVQRYLYARAFAGRRFERAGWARRLVYGLGAFLLPPLLSARIITRTWTSRRHRPELVRALPLLVPFVLSWATGEIIGTWFGADDALARVC